MAAIQEQNNFKMGADFLDLLSKYKGSSQTTTTSSNISAEGVNAMIADILGGSQGLAAVASGQKAAGGYNSSTNQLLINDLIARTTAQVAKAQAGTTSTTRTSGSKSSGLNTAVASLVLASKLKNTSLGKSATQKFNSLFSDNASNAEDSSGVIGQELGSGAGSLGTSAITGTLDSPGISSFGDGTSAGAIADFANGLTDFSGGDGSDIASVIGGGADTAQGIDEAATAADYVNEMDKASDAYSAGTAADASSSGGSALGYVGPALNAYAASQTDGDYRKAIGGAILNYFGAGAATPIVDKVARPISDAAMDNGEDVNGVAGALAAEPIGTVASGQYNGGDVFDAASDPADLFGGNEGGSINGLTATLIDPIGSFSGSTDVKDALDDIGDTVICTELNKQGLLSDVDYAISQLHSLDLPAKTKAGYHYWAVPVVRRMRKSAPLNFALAPLVRSRVRYLRGHWTLFGALSVWIGQPICFLIGSVVGTQNWKALNHGN